MSDKIKVIIGIAVFAVILVLFSIVMTSFTPNFFIAVVEINTEQQEEALVAGYKCANYEIRCDSIAETPFGDNTKEVIISLDWTLSGVFGNPKMNAKNIVDKWLTVSGVEHTQLRKNS